MSARWMTPPRARFGAAAALSFFLFACRGGDPIVEPPPIQVEECEHAVCGIACCGENERCAVGECVPLDAPCATTEDCGEGQICLQSERRCIAREELGACRYVPPTGVFRPTIECSYRPREGDPYARFSNVAMAPAVANLTDDDGDGRTGGPGDVPDVVFVSFDMATDGCCTNQGVLRIVSGECVDGELSELATIAFDPETGERLHFDNSAGVAIGDLDPAGDPDLAVPEIVAILRTGGTGQTIALRRVTDDGREWAVMWRNRRYPTFEHFQGGNVQHGGPQPSIADVDSDGRAEVVIGNVVLNGQTGELIWDGFETVGPDAGVGNNGFLGPISVVADVDLDGRNELIAGDTIYDAATGALRGRLDWGTSGGSCPGVGIRCDGFVGIANFDGEPRAEIVSVRRGEVGLFGAFGTQRALVRLPGGDMNNEGGPPTIADFDGDGQLEIGVAGAVYYTVIDFECQGSPLPSHCYAENIRWVHPIEDRSSRATGSSVFDFEGDGRAEVVYADEQNFYIFDGVTGEALFRDTTHRSNTRLELPVVVDLDADGQAEVIVARADGGGGMVGLDVFGDADRNWVRTRRIWNQHAYFVGNVRELGTIPTYPVQSFTSPSMNSFRQNVHQGDVHDAPDLVVTHVDVGRCGPGSDVGISFRVENLGVAWVGAGVHVRVRVEANDQVHDLPLLTIARPLDPGESVELGLTLDGEERSYDDARITITVDYDPDSPRGRYNECDEENNTVTAGVLDRCIGPG